MASGDATEFFISETNQKKCWSDSILNFDPHSEKNIDLWNLEVERIGREIQHLKEKLKLNNEENQISLNFFSREGKRSF